MISVNLRVAYIFNNLKFTFCVVGLFIGHYYEFQFKKISVLVHHCITNFDGLLIK